MRFGAINVTMINTAGIISVDVPLATTQRVLNFQSAVLQKGEGEL
jgi:hypothetical protein